MAPADTAAIAISALRAHPLRSILTMLGIIVGVSAVIAMVAVGAGAQVRVTEQIRSLGANLLMVQPDAPAEGAGRPSGGRPLTQGDANAVAAQVPRVVVAAPSVRGSARIINGNRNWTTTINGTTSDYFRAREWAASQGRYFSADEGVKGAKVAIVGATVAKALFGDTGPLGRLVRIADVPFLVVGVLAAKGSSGNGQDQDDVVFVPLSTAKVRLLGGRDRVNRDALNYILVKVADDRSIPSVATEIEGLLRDRHRLPAGTPNDFTVWNPAAAFEVQQETTRTMSFLLATIASVALVVGGISIMNIMLVSVTERTREVGLRLALGARRRDIQYQFLTEAVALSLAGGLAGVIVGITGAAVLSRLSGWPVFIGAEAVLASLFFALLVGIFFGFYPALKASRLDPIQALRFE